MRTESWEKRNLLPDFFFFIIMFVLKGVRSTLGNGTSKDAEDTGKIIKEWSRTQEGVRGRAQ